MAFRDPASLAHGFEEYRSGVIPADATDEQVIETRRAFYAGALCLMLIGIKGPGALNKAQEEIRRFAASDASSDPEGRTRQ